MRRGYAFAIVRRVATATSRNIRFRSYFPCGRPRTYIERINVRGNTRTRDYVIRREFDIAKAMPTTGRWSIVPSPAENLDFFKSVKITTEPGCRATRDSHRWIRGEIHRRFLDLGGYSTTDGAMGEVSVSERNFLGRACLPKPACIRAIRRATRCPLSSRIFWITASLWDWILPAPAARNNYVSYNTETIGFSRDWASVCGKTCAAGSLFDLSAESLAAGGFNNCNNVQFLPDGWRIRRSIEPGLLERDRIGNPTDRLWAATSTANPRCRPQGTGRWQDPDVSIGYTLNYNTWTTTRTDRRSVHRVEAGLRGVGGE